MPEPILTELILTDPVLNIPIKTIGAAGSHDETAAIIQETNIKIVFNDKLLASSACCGLHLEELAIGFLFAEGYIAARSDLTSVVVDKASGTVLLTGKSRLTVDDNIPASIASSGARTRSGLNATSHQEHQLSFNDNVRIAAHLINTLFDALVAGATLHQSTRGTHSGAICDERGIIVLREDIGRHNVADMLIGYALNNEIDLSDKYIVRTGRVSLEIATKYRRAGIRILLSLSVPTIGAIEYAKREGMCLVSSRRDKTITVYTDYERVK